MNTTLAPKVGHTDGTTAGWKGFDVIVELSVHYDMHSKKKRLS